MGARGIGCEYIVQGDDTGSRFFVSVLPDGPVEVAISRPAEKPNDFTSYPEALDRMVELAKADQP